MNSFEAAVKEALVHLLSQHSKQGNEPGAKSETLIQKLESSAIDLETNKPVGQVSGSATISNPYQLSQQLNEQQVASSLNPLDSLTFDKK